MVSLILVFTGPAHLLDRLVQGQALHLLAVELRDDVVRHDAGFRGGRLVDRRDDLDEAVFHRDLDAEPAELALGLHLHVAEVLRVHVARMRVEPVEHPVDRLLDQLRIVGLLDVVGAHALEHVAEQIELAVGVRGGGLRAGPQDQPRLRGEERDRNASGCAEEHQGSRLAYHPRTFSLLVTAHQGLGSTGVPSLRNSIYRTGWLEPVAIAAADCGPPPITATGSPVSTNWPKSTEIRSIPARSTWYPPPAFRIKSCP